MKKIQNEFIVYLLELLAQFEPVEAKSMFGGFGIYKQGLMFGLVSNDTVYFKADDQNRSDFEERKLPPFTYERKGKTLSMSYYRVPSDAMEDDEILCQWAEKSYEAALRADKKKKKKKAKK